MNLTSRKARTLIALCSTTAVAAGALAFAATASATNALRITPDTGTGSKAPVKTLNLGHEWTADAEGTAQGSIPQRLADAAYSVHVDYDDASSNNHAQYTYVVFEKYTSPSGEQTIAPEDVNLYYAAGDRNSTEAPATGWQQADGENASEPDAVLGNVLDQGWVDPDGAGAASAATRRILALTDSVYLTADTPGTYQVAFRDTRGDSDYGNDYVSESLTIEVKDVYQESEGTSADWRPVVNSQPASALMLSPIAASINLGGTGAQALTLNDQRGKNARLISYLSTKVAALVGLRFDSPSAALKADLGLASTCGPDALKTVCTDIEPLVAEAESGSRTVLVGSAKHTGSVDSYAYFDHDGVDGWDWDNDGDGIAEADDQFGLDGNSEVVENDVTGLEVKAVKVTGQVGQELGADEVSVKTATPSTTFVAQAEWDEPVPSDKSGRTIFFDLDPGYGNPQFSTDATLVDPVTFIYSAVTDRQGKATIKVTPTKTLKDTAYVLKAVSTVQATPLQVTYGDSTGSQIKITNTPSSLAPVVGTQNVVITGKLLDQFDEVFQPPSTQSTQITVDTPAGSNVDGTATLSGGAFSYTYIPRGTPSVGQQDVLEFCYDDPSGDGACEEITVRWSSAESAKSVTITVPVNGAQKVQLSDSQIVAPGQFLDDGSTYGNDEAEVKGSVSDESGRPLANKTVKLTGTEGVYFSEEPEGTELQTSIEVNTNSSGIFNQRYAFFTKSGDVTITATSGTASKTVNLSTEDPIEGYKVEVNDVTAGPGENTVISGKVTDMFGNGVPGYPVHLSLSNATLGNLQVIDPLSNDSGVFSTSYAVDANSNGTATVTATLAKNNGDEDLYDDDAVTVPLGTSELQSQNLKPENDEWVEIAELPEFAEGQYKDTADLTVVPNTITITAPATRPGPGTVTVSGVARKGASVEIYKKLAGTDEALGWVRTVSADTTTGAYSTDIVISKSTTFVAKAGTATSPEVTVEIIGLTVPTTKVGGGYITVKGFATPGSTVKIEKKNYGSSDVNFVAVGTATADAETGAYSKSVKLIRSTTFRASTETAVSAKKATKVKSTVSFYGNKALGGGKYRLGANGGPNGGKGILTFYQSTSAGLKKIASVKSNSYGIGSVTWTTSRGYKKVRVYYTAPGCTKSKAAAATVRVS